MSEMTDREARAEETYARLFGPRDRSAPDNDPEFGRILRTFIFGDVFATGDLNDTTRELITVTVLATLNTLPQLKAHTRAALKVGVTPVELREAVYQLAPFIGFPRTLNAVAALNEVFDALGIALPLAPQTTTTDSDRYARGRAIQAPLYGTEIADELADEPLAGVLPGCSPSSSSATSTAAPGWTLRPANCWSFAPWRPSASSASCDPTSPAPSRPAAAATPCSRRSSTVSPTSDSPTR
jgi:4-carboxymuconolactone decarboxylase